MSRLNSSIVVKLAASFLVAALIPVSVALVMFERETACNLTRQVESQLESLALSRRSLLEEHISSLQDGAADLAASDALSRYLSEVKSDSRCSPHAEANAAQAWELVRSAQDEIRDERHRFFLTDSVGDVVADPSSSNQDHDASDDSTAGDSIVDAPRSISGHGVFQSALLEPAVSPFFQLETGDGSGQLILHPVRSKEGVTLGLVGVEVSAHCLTRVLSHGFALGESGTIRLATNATAEGSQGVAQALGSGDLTFGDYTVDGGREVFGAYLPSAHHPWAVCVEIDRAEILGPTAALRTYMLKILGTTSLVLGLVGMLLGMWFGKPLMRCAAAAHRVSEGNIEEPIPISRGRDEIGTLERATESMRERLYTQIQTLDQRVEEKTLQLSQLLEEVRSSQDRFALAVRGSKDGIWDWDLETNTIYFAPRWKELLGLEEDQIGDSPEAWFELIAEGERTDFQRLLGQHIEGETDQFDTEVMMRHGDGKPRWMLCRAAAIRDENGKAVRLAGSLADITALKRAQMDLRRMANHDRLTGLPNRELFKDRLQQAIARSRRGTDTEFAVLFFDFDRFKVINDSLGHNVGDALLVSIAKRFHKELREADTAARFGGDEFVVILDNVHDLRTAEDVCARLLRAFAEPHFLLGHEVVSTASIGLVMHNGAYDNAAAMIRDADTSMYQAKTAGRAQYRIFDREMHSDAVSRMKLEQEMRSADLDEEFRLVYQSIVSLETGEIVGFEALLRWQHPEHGLMTPDEFVQIAEETGLIVPIGEWALWRATHQLVEWQAEFGRKDSLFMNLNLGRRQLLHPSLVETLVDLNERFDLERGDIRLEIAETTVMDERHDMMPIMQEIRDLGFLVAMDGFGTGYSSLSGLHRFPIDLLHIDRTFIAHLGESSEFTAVVQAIVTLARHLDLEVLAEGVETAEQLAQLEELGCAYAQGYLFAEPVSADEAEQALRKGMPRVA